MFAQKTKKNPLLNYIVESVLIYVLFLKFDKRGFSFFKKTPRTVLFICIGTYYIL